jgi:lia operon protein LiaG
MLQRFLTAVATSALLVPVLASAQGVERFTLRGREVAVYNLVGTLRVEGGAGDAVVVEVTRVGADAARLTLDDGDVRGRAALRVRYPEDRIVYPRLGSDNRSTIGVNEDGTFGEDGGGWRQRRRVEVRSRGDGMDAHADLRVIVPKGKSLFVRNGVGETTIDNVEGQLNVSVAAARVHATRLRGSLSLDTGSGGVEVSDVTGDLRLDSGSGGAVLDGVRGGILHLDVGSGSVRGRSIDVTELVGDIGSGGVRLASVRTPKLQLETGSGGSDVELTTPPSDVSIEAGSGGVTLRIPATSGAAVDIETGSGGIDTDFEVNVSRMERRSLTGTFGDGRGRIRIRAGSGTVRLLKI